MCSTYFVACCIGQTYYTIYVGLYIPSSSGKVSKPSLYSVVLNVLVPILHGDIVRPNDPTHLGHTPHARSYENYQFILGPVLYSLT